MEELQKQVKVEMLRSVLWIAIAMGIGIGIFYLVW
jgi:hypothetical protein